MTKFSELPINENDLNRVAGFLAPHYAISPEEKISEIRAVIASSRDARESIETAGYIAIRSKNFEGIESVRVFIGNHLIGCSVLKISAPGKKFKEKVVKDSIPFFLPHK